MCLSSLGISWYFLPLVKKWYIDEINHSVDQIAETSGIGFYWKIPRNFLARSPWTWEAGAGSGDSPAADMGCVVAGGGGCDGCRYVL